MVGLSVIPCLGSAKKNQKGELSRQRPSWTCFKVLKFRNPVSHFQLGRRAAHVAKTVAELTVYGRELLEHEIAQYPPNFLLPPDSKYLKFGSRQDAYEKLWKALVNENGHPVLGIYGMPGVGKSRMMEQAFEEAINKKIFDTVTRANVGGEHLDVIKVQAQIANCLNCHLEPEDVGVRASKLKSSLMKGGKTLIMLDDVWEVIPLKYIGIPFGDDSSKGCKILFTSRRLDVCLLNNCKDPIEIKTLTEDEAWEMFENTVTTKKIKDLEDNNLAKKVCEECGALPLLIYAVGNQLKFLTENSWIDTLSQLENCKLEQIDGMDQYVYPSLEMSFKKLKDGPKTCLLLCSILFREDTDVDIRTLSDLATGSQFLDSKKNIRRYIDILKSSCLLLEGKDHYTIKMNGIIRDVARSIAVRDPKYANLYIRCSSQLPRDIYYHTIKLLQLDLEGDNVRFPNDLVCPYLHTLWLQCNNHSQQHLSGFIIRFMNLRSLVIKGMSFSQHELSADSLDNLRVLILEDCDVSQTFLNSIPKNLETLSIRDCHLPSPLYLPQLKKLRKLELFSQTQVETVAETVSSLLRLQEMNIPGGIRTLDAAATSISAGSNH